MIEAVQPMPQVPAGGSLGAATAFAELSMPKLDAGSMTPTTEVRR